MDKISELDLKVLEFFTSPLRCLAIFMPCLVQKVDEQLRSGRLTVCKTRSIFQRYPEIPGKLDNDLRHHETCCTASVFVQEQGIEHIYVDEIPFGRGHDCILVISNPDTNIVRECVKVI